MMKAAHAWCASILILAASLGSAEAPPANAERIAFLRLTEGYWQLWVMNADGGGARPLTRTPVDKVHAAWRPGTTSQLSYHTNQGETALLDVESGEEQPLLEGLRVTDAAWTADGRRLAYSLPPDDLVNGETSLWVSGIDGKDRRQIAGGDGTDAIAPTWLADGRRLLYRQCTMVDNMTVRHDFWVVDPAESHPARRLSGDPDRLKFDQTVSSLGVVAYSAPRTGGYEIWTLPLEGGTPQQVTRTGTYAGNPSWSPAGDALAFEAIENGTLQVYRANPDGSGRRALTNVAHPSRKPVWGPVPLRQPAPAAMTEPPVRETPAAIATDATPVAPPAEPPTGIALSWVTTDRAVIDLRKAESLTLRFQVSRPAAVTVRFLTVDGEPVRTIRHEAVPAGEQQVVWDGKDDTGQPVRPEAYIYTLEARSLEGASAIYDLRSRTGGEVLSAEQASIDREKGRIRYVLPDSARVRLILSRGAWPIRTLVDWEPREAGPQDEAWDGWDAGRVVQALETSDLLPIVYAFSLPRNSVIVKGAPVAGKRGPGPTAGQVPAAIATERRVHLHSLHARAHCYDPKVQASIVGGPELREGEVPSLDGPTTFRFDVAPDQPPDRATPIRRVSVFIYVDGRLVERYLVGYAPFQWTIDPATLTPGEHVITGLLSWREDHFGMTHVRVKVTQQ
jgi:hypothetical protein